MVGRFIEAIPSGLVTVAHVEAGTTNNIFPHHAWMEGTIRAHDEHTCESFEDKVGRVAEGNAAAHGCTCTTDVAFVAMLRTVMGAEDFSYVLQNMPGSMAFRGVCPDDEHWSTAAPNHSNLMRMKEDAMRSGVALYAGMALVG